MGHVQPLAVETVMVLSVIEFIQSKAAKNSPHQSLNAVKRNAQQVRDADGLIPACGNTMSWPYFRQHRVWERLWFYASKKAKRSLVARFTRFVSQKPW